MIARVAVGGMATLHYARVLADGRPVAVKVMHPHLAEDDAMREMFLHEARLARRLRHPNMVEVLEAGEDPDLGPFLVMEYVEGGTLSDVMEAARARQLRLPPPAVARLCLDLAHALHAAHSLMGEDGSPLHLVHRDVSPDNVLVGVDGRARLVDFGIAKSDDRYTRTRQGELKGKLAYMSPERLAKSAPVDRRVDVYAAGIVLWEALLSRRLFEAESEMAMVDQVLRPVITPPSAYHRELAPYDPVIARALAFQPADRFATAADLGDAISRAASALGGVADREATALAVRDLLADVVARRRAKIGEGKTLSETLAPLEDEADTVLEANAFSDDEPEPTPFEPPRLADVAVVAPVFPHVEATPTEVSSPSRPPPAATHAPMIGAASASERGRALRWIALGAVACLLLGLLAGALVAHC